MADSPVVEVKDGEGKPVEAAKESPAKDIRMIQALLVNGIFPGQAAPQIVQSYSLLEKMAVEIENAAK